MTGQYAADTLWGRGRRMEHIPEELVQILNNTYEHRKDYVVPGDEDDRDAEEIIRLGKIYARRKNLSFRHKFTDDGKLRFRITDKRQYNKTNGGHR